MRRKLFLLLLLLFTTFSLISCKDEGEYVIKDSNLTQSVAVDDHYRVFYEIKQIILRFFNFNFKLVMS